VFVVRLWRTEVRRAAKTRWRRWTRSIRATWVRGPDCRSRTSRPSTWPTAPTAALTRRLWRDRASTAVIRTRTTAVDASVQTASKDSSATQSSDRFRVRCVCSMLCPRCVKGKGKVLDIKRRLTVRSSALQPWKWQLTGIGYSTAAQANGAHCPRNGLWTRSYAARRITLQSATLDLHPVIHIPNYMDYYSFTDPLGMDGWVGHVGWPIADGLTTKWSAIQLAVWRRIWKVRRPRPAFYTTMLRRQRNAVSAVVRSKAVGGQQAEPLKGVWSWELM